MNLRRTLSSVSEPYLWRIENDSVFVEDDWVQSGSFLWEAVELLEQEPEVAVVHLRRWTPVDRADLPGGAANMARVAGKCAGGLVIERRPVPLVWVDATRDLPRCFTPDREVGYGCCPAYDCAGAVRGAVRARGKGWERLVAEKFATYTHHGWVGRVRVLRKLVEQADAKSEEEIAAAVRAGALAARLEQDAFIAAGWRTRVKWSPALHEYALRWARMHPSGTAVDAGGTEHVDDESVIVCSRIQKTSRGTPS